MRQITYMLTPHVVYRLTRLTMTDTDSSQRFIAEIGDIEDGKTIINDAVLAHCRNMDQFTITPFTDTPDGGLYTVIEEKGGYRPKTLVLSHTAEEDAAIMAATPPDLRDEPVSTTRERIETRRRQLLAELDDLDRRAQAHVEGAVAIPESPLARIAEDIKAGTATFCAPHKLDPEDQNWDAA